jgi:hypothetical protein
MPPTTFQFEIQISAVGGELELDLTTGQNDQKDRRNQNTGNGNGRGQRRKDFIKAQKASRRVPSAPEENFIGPHVPIILIDHPNVNDVIVWKCQDPFMVDMSIDNSYTKQGNPPRSPLVNMDTDQDFSVMPQTAIRDGSFNNMYFVRGQFRRGTGASDQLFYKTSVWSGGLTIDPDVYTDDGL